MIILKDKVCFQFSKLLSYILNDFFIYLSLSLLCVLLFIYEWLFL